jgi:hypothetical protein
VVLGWLYGEDFGDSLCKAVNCGDDTDCTGATLGSILGIIGGTKGIPARWSEPLGTKINTVAIAGFDPPADIDDLTEQTVDMAKKVKERHSLPFRVDGQPASLELLDLEAAHALWSRSPFAVTYRTKGLTLVLDYMSQPTAKDGVARHLGISLHNTGVNALEVQISANEVPDGWECGLSRTLLTLGPGKREEISLAILTDGADGKLLLSADAEDISIELPVALFRPLEAGEPAGSV